MAHIPVSTDVDAAFSALDALRAVSVPISNAVVIGARITYKYRLDSVITPGSGEPLIRRGTFLFAVDPPSPAAIVAVPSINDSTLVTSGPLAGYQIDRTNSDVAAFIEAIVSNGVTNQFGDDITACIVAAIQSRV